LLLKEGSPREIAHLVETILDDPALGARLSANARAFAASHYDIGVQTRELENFLRQLI
jgi:glycosyltransferase involved in cell wall biosynthesis